MAYIFLLLRLLFLSLAVNCLITPDDRIQELNDWIGNAMELSGSVDQDIKERIPHMIIVGDQGVGKSTTLNRLVNEEIFPPRTKEQADHDAPQTMIATVYRAQKGTHFIAKVSCSSTSCDEWEEKQVTTLENVQKSVELLQSTCFNGSEFDTDLKISVSIQGPSVTDSLLVDLPGIQQGSSEGYEKTRALTQKWLAEYKHSIILAVIPAERNLQSEIVRILQENSEFSRRTVLIVTKPQSIPRESAKVLNLLADAKVKSLCAARIVVLKSADTSVPEESSWTLAKQVDEEATWFKQHPQYSKSSEHCGIHALQKMSSKVFIREACAVLPPLQQDMLRKQQSVEEKLALLPEVFNTEDAVTLSMDYMRNFAEDSIRSNRIFYEIYQEMLSSEVDPHLALSQVAGGLPEYGMERFTARHPFFEKWIETSKSWLSKLKAQMQNVFVEASRSAVDHIKGSTGSGFQAFAVLAECREADRAIKRAIVSHRFELEDTSKLDQKDKLTAFVNSLGQKIPDMIVRLAIQMCVAEPIEELRTLIRTLNNGALLRNLHRNFDMADVISERSRLQSEWEAYSVLMASEPCAGVEQVRVSGDIAKRVDKLERPSDTIVEFEGLDAEHDAFAPPPVPVIINPRSMFR